MAAEKVVVTKSKLDNLAEIISSKSEEPIPLTIDEMSAAVLDLNLVNNQNNITVTPTVSEQIITPESPYTGLDSVTVEAISPVRTQDDLSVNGPYVDVPKGWYPQSVLGQVGPGSLGTPTFNRYDGTGYVRLTPVSSIQAAGYMNNGSSLAGNSVTIYASDLAAGTKNITTNGEHNVAAYKTANVNVPAPTPTALTITPTTSQQDFSDGPYNPVTVSAINIQSLEVTPSSETQVFNAIEKQLLTKLTTSQGKNNINLQISSSVNPISIGDTIYVSGYLLHGSGSIKDISKTIVVSSDQTQSYYVSLNSSRRVNVTLFRVASGTYSLNIALEDNSGNLITNQLFYIKENPDFDNTNTVGVFKGTKIADGYLPVTVNSIPSEYIIPEGTLEVTQNGTSDVTNYASVDVNVQPTLQSKTVTPTESQQTVSPDSGYDALSSVAVDAISSMYVGSGITQRSSTDLTASGATVTVPAGYYSSQASKAVSSGYATGPSSLSASSATVSTGTNTITLTKTGVTTTPTVSAGYVSSATSSTATVALTASVTTKGATTYTPGTTDQTISSGTYLTGTQTISGDSYLVAENIKKDVTIFGITGTAEPSLIAKTVTPTAETQVVSANATYIRFGPANPTSTVSNTRYWDIYRYYVDNDIVLGETYHIEVSFYRSGYSRTYTAELDSIISSFPFNITVRASSSQTATITLNTISNGYRFSNNLYGDEDDQGRDTLTVSITQVADGLSQVTVNGDADLVAGNVKQGVTIFGVEGTYTGAGSTIDSLSVTPSESEQTFNSSSVDGYKPVVVGAISSTYVGSGITRRSSSDLSAPLNTVTVPAGYYAEDASKTISNGSVTVTTAKGNVVSNSVKVFGSVNYTQGFIGSGSQNDSTGIIIHASDLVSGDKAITQNGTDIDVTNYATVSVNVQPTLQSKIVTPTENSQTITPDTGYDGMDEVTVDAISSSYVGSGIDRRSSSDLTGDYGASAAGKYTVTAPSGYYESDATYSLTSKGASNITTSTSGGNLTVAWEQGFYGGGGKTIATVKDSDDLTVSGATVTVPAGYYETAASASVASGSASTPATSITANPTISVSSSGLITASVSASQNVTPTVSAGYVSSGTAGTVSVSGSKTQQLTTKAAATITPGTTNQTIAAGTYLTGTQTIAGDADLVAGNIKSGVQIFGVTGNLSFITYYTGSSTPSSALGSDGDIYLKVAS